MNVEYIESNMLKQMIIAGANYLERNKQYVDELNVFPVPDGDTGTNMSLTVVAAAKEVQKTESENITDIAKALSSGSLRGARGNSGVILSQLCRGFYLGLNKVDIFDTTAMANAFQKGVETAYKAVMKPKEGTILTVARALSEKAMELSLESNDVHYVLQESIKYGEEVLDKTPDMLPVLKQAGVVDAGGQGLIIIFKGALAVLEGNYDIKETYESELITEDKNKAQQIIDTENIKYAYCTEFIINVEVDSYNEKELKDYLLSIGDSAVVVCDDDIIKIHVHTNNPGNVIQKGLTYGYLTNMKIDNMKVQHKSVLQINSNKPTKVEEKLEKTEVKDIGFIAVSIGEGLTEIFRGLGADNIVEGGQTMNPSTEDILNAVDKVNAKNVFILPNNKNIILAAEQAKQLSKDKKIYVIPTKTIPQGISALISYDDKNTVEENYDNMIDAISWVKTGQITFAVRDTSVEDHEIKKDDILGIGENKILEVGSDIELTTKNLIKQMVDEDSELITIYYGKEIKPEETERLVSFIEEEFEDCEVEIHYGGQPLYYYIISIE